MSKGSAIVTGSGGRGSGRAIALKLAREGYSVAVSDIVDEGGQETVRLIVEAGGRAAYCHANVAREEDIRKLVAFTERELGPLAILVNNASDPAFEPNTPWREHVEIDLLGSMTATRCAIEAMRRSGGGAIVNIASTSALWHGRHNSGVPGYDVAKAGLIRLTTALAFLGEKEGIRVNCLAPGWIATHGPLEYWQSLTQEERLARGVPSRLLAATDIAEGVFRLATDETLAGRVIFWWSEDVPRLIADGDPGYSESDEYPLL
ncbi:MAG TPA: SDR family NAD(P)-dependent oxidoreductase [Rhizomicrobium sp.]|jgi:NAD(P)-dependent dehydrogenase (short-subunit alcohol dehydrogenase family)